MSILIIAPICLGLIGLAFGIGLAYASKKFEVEVDPRAEEIESSLPGANCGACGLPGCSGLAKAIASGKAEINACPVGGEELVKKIAAIMGVEAVAGVKKIACVHCTNGQGTVKNKTEYTGITDCRAAALIAGGFLECRYGCLGLGSCVEACPFEAIKMGPLGVPVIIEERCTSCGKCVDACPKNLIDLIPADKNVVIRCSSLDRGKPVSSVCKTGCIGCTKCVKTCPEKAISMNGFLAVIDYEKCTDCASCVDGCPSNTIEDAISATRPKPEPKEDIKEVAEKQD